MVMTLLAKVHMQEGESPVPLKADALIYAIVSAKSLFVCINEEH